MAFDKRKKLASPSGATLNLYRHSASGPALGVVQINHGLAEHAARYAPFAEYLGGHGFHVYAHDHRGHGHTKAPDTRLGHFSNGEPVLADVLAVHEHIAAAYPGLPVIIFGHSMGAIIALNFALRHPARIRAGALWNPPLANGLESRAARIVLAWERFRLGSDVPSRLLPRLTFQAWASAIPNARTEHDWLSNDAEQVSLYQADPLCGWQPSIGMWRAIFDWSQTIADNHAFDVAPRTLPLHLIAGGQDPSTRGGKLVQRLAKRLIRLGFSNLETRIYAENRHESLNEINRNVIMRDFADWAKKIIN